MEQISLINTQILHYKIISKLGEGGMGVVYKAEDTKLRREVAIKFLPRRIAPTNDERERFKIEAQAAAALNHPNIATIYAIEEVEDEVFIVMEYVEGQELQERIRSGALDQNLAIEYAIQIASGLQAAHEKNIVHRDIKPANILITDKAQVRIMDFGLAKLGGRTRLTKEGTSMGTIAYMSPEQTHASGVDNRTDIWALGAVMYEMITGKPPFAGDYDQAVIYSILNDDPEPPTALHSELSEELERVVLKALQKEPAGRYQHIDEMLEDLKLLKNGLTTGVSSSQKPVAAPAPAGLSASNGNDNRRLMIGVPVLLILVALAAYPFLQKDSPGTLAPEKKSIAVLPFENLSALAENEYFSDGITEDIISRISKISGLRVISRTSVMRYKKTKKSISQIADELNVTTVLEGSVRRSNNQVRIVAQLIDAINDENLWSETFDRELDQIFAIQSEVAQLIGTSLQTRLSPRDQQLLTRQSTENLEAYTLYLKGRHAFLKYTEESFREGLDLAHQAIERDPEYALAYAGLAEAYYRAASLYMPSNEAMPKAKEAALEAVRLDDTLAQAWMALAVVTYRYDYDWEQAEELFKRALDLNPGDATIHEEYGSSFLMGQGRFDEAVSQLKHALRLDPYSAAIHMKLQMTYYYQRAYRLSIVQSDLLQSLHPDYATSHLLHGLALQELGRTGDAITSLEKAIEAGYSEDLANAYLLLAYYRANDVAKAEKLLQGVKEKVDEQPDMNYQLARIHAELGHTQEALYWLEKAYEMKNEFLMWLKVDPPFDRIRNEARYQEILRKIGLTP